MNEIQLLEEQRKKNPNLNVKPSEDSGLPPEEVNYEPKIFSEYEKKHGVPFLVDKLKIKNNFKIDEDIGIKVYAIEEFLKDNIIKEKLRDSLISYENILDRILSRMPESLERMISTKKGISVLDFVFREIALKQNLSSISYLKQYTEHYKYQKVEKLTKQLQEFLATL